MRHEPPIEANMVDELFDFWLPIFDGEIDFAPDALLGHELPYSRITVYTHRIGGELAGACLVASSPDMPALGGLGEVATSPEARGRGIATTLTRQALDNFGARGGQTIFLGTFNPDAARIYYRLGWRKLAGANLMLNVLNGKSPEEFLVDYFRALGAATVRTPSPADRAPMIPLIVSPHDWQALDFNIGIFSTRYAALDSCMGLYRRYAAIANDGRGAWFCASTDAGHVVGLSTARLDDNGGCQVDGFTHRNYANLWQELIRAAVDWGAGKGVSRIYAAVSVEDDEKRALFETLGFGSAGNGDAFNLSGRQVGTLRLELR